MDFLEGFLMGPFWTDTEYESRHHVGFYLLMGLAVSGLFVFWLIQPVAGLLSIPWAVPALLLTLMLLINPYLCRNYYRRPLYLRLLILLALIIKQLLALLLLFTAALPFIHLDLAGLTNQLMNFVNEDIAAMTDRLSNLSNAAAMILGLILGSLYSLVKLLLVAAAGVVIPGLTLILVRWLQLALDWLIRRKLLRESEG